VQAFGFVSAGECNDFLARALRDLVQHEPLASVALIARHPEQARLYFEALAAAEVPDCVWWLTRIFCSGPGSMSPTWCRPKDWNSTS